MSTVHYVAVPPGGFALVNVARFEPDPFDVVAFERSPRRWTELRREVVECNLSFGYRMIIAERDPMHVIRTGLHAAADQVAEKVRREILTRGGEAIAKFIHERPY